MAGRLREAGRRQRRTTSGLIEADVMTLEIQTKDSPTTRPISPGYDPRLWLHLAYPDHLADWQSSPWLVANRPQLGKSSKSGSGGQAGFPLRSSMRV